MCQRPSAAVAVSESKADLRAVGPFHHCQPDRLPLRSVDCASGLNGLKPLTAVTPVTHSLDLPICARRCTNSPVCSRERQCLRQIRRSHVTCLPREAPSASFASAASHEAFKLQACQCHFCSGGARPDGHAGCRPAASSSQCPEWNDSTKVPATFDKFCTKEAHKRERAFSKAPRKTGRGADALVKMDPKGEATKSRAPCGSAPLELPDFFPLQERMLLS
ncbi:uncharacterized protein [Dermacentor albipictus]|uniref:uncharacterized protein n=1 Tax=Dermacentor albipictus TaxID=60249 RepID=UPI0031FE3FEA